MIFKKIVYDFDYNFEITTKKGTKVEFGCPFSMLFWGSFSLRDSSLNESELELLVNKMLDLTERNFENNILNSNFSIEKEIEKIYSDFKNDK